MCHRLNQELKSFRDKLTMDQWNGWLQFARNEKNLLKKVKLKQKSPSKTMAIFKQSPNELLQSLMKSEVEQRLTNENDLAESPSERPISDHSADMHLSQSSRAFSLKDIEMPIVDNSEKSEFAPPGPVASNKFDAPEVVVPQSTSDRPQSAATAGVVDEQDTLLRATVTFATAFVEPLPPSVPCTAIPVPAVGTKPESDPDRAAAASPGAKDLSLSTTIPHEIHTQCVEPPGRRNSQDTATHHQSNCLHTSTPSPTSTHSVDMNMEVGVSLQRGSMVGRGSRGGQVGVGSKHRAASAPRERVDASAAQINHSISNKHPGLDSPHFLRSSWTDEHKNINITYSAKQKTFSQTQAPLHPHFFCPKQRGSLSDGFPNKLEHNYHAVNVERSLRHPGAPDHFLNLAQRSLNEGNQTHPNRGYSPSLNLQEAAEIARSTAFRLDSAFSAAQCLLGSFAADQSLTATAPTFLTSQAAEGASNSDKYAPICYYFHFIIVHLTNTILCTVNRMQTTLSILAEMMSSMEKSKAALEQLSSLHLQGSTASVHADSSGPATARPHRRPPQQQHHDQQQEDHRGSTPTTHQRRRHGSSNHYGSRSGRHRHPAGSAAEHNAGTPSGSSKSSGSEECEGEVEGAGVGFEPSMGYPPSHRMGSSPLETNIFRSVPRGQQRDRWDADSQVLSFEDLSNSYSNSNPARTHSPMQHHPQHRRNTEPDGNTHGTPRSKGEFKWFPDNSLSSSGAKLNAAYAQDKAHEDFSEWNKQMLTSAFAEAGTQQESPHDAKAKLQSQLFEATDSARRASVYNSTLTLTPQGGRSQQFQYSSSGYIWEGVRYSRAQGPVARLCFVSGPRWKVSIQHVCYLLFYW